VAFIAAKYFIMATWTAWVSKDGGQITLVNGQDPPRFANGKLQPDCETLLWRIEAATLEEASAIHHLRLGWEPYKPEGEPAPLSEV
jgi:hypothetical protein